MRFHPSLGDHVMNRTALSENLQLPISVKAVGISTLRTHVDVDPIGGTRPAEGLTS
jgi:hypothetical protein